MQARRTHATAASLLGLAVLVATPLQAQRRTGASPAHENVLVILADDVGVDAVGAYGLHPDPGPTPNVDKLASRGVLFRNAWAYPKCSPSRATLLTGLYAFRTGVVEVSLNETVLPGLRSQEVTIPELLGPSWSSAAVGKWHLATGAQGILHPWESGFRWFTGTLYNLGKNRTPGDYFVWEKTLNVQGRLGPVGLSTISKTYATTDQVDDAIVAVRTLPEPWFVWLAFSAPHQPYHDPPARLHSQDLDPTKPELTVRRFKAMKEAMDREMGRLLAFVPDNTTIVFLGDNGTPGEATTAPFRSRRAKGTVYEGGVHVPLIVAGPRVAQPGSECFGLVDATDLFATVAEIAGVPSTSPDAESFLPYLADPGLPSRRRFAYAEFFLPLGFGPYSRFDRAVRDERYKLVRRFARQGTGFTVTSELYDLWKDPLEYTDLMLAGPLGAAQQRAYDGLSAHMENLTRTPGFNGARQGGEPDRTTFEERP